MKTTHKHGHREGQQTSGNGYLSQLLQKKPKYELEERQLWGYNSSSLKLESCEGTDSLCQRDAKHVLKKRKEKTKQKYGVIFHGTAPLKNNLTLGGCKGLRDLSA